MNRDFEEEVTAHLERAQHSLQGALTLFDAALFNDAASRAYYAVFHAASAALMARGLTFKKHSALIGAVHKHFVHAGKATKESGKWLTWLFELRAVGDYGEIVRVDEAQARLAIERAQSLVEVFRQLSQDA